MYENKTPLTKKKVTEVIILICLVVWGLFFLIDYVRYSSGNPPIFALRLKAKYDDGYVKEYYGLGYVYRNYNRDSIHKVEFGPFWMPRQNPVATPDIPPTHKDYEVPSNNMRLEKYMGLIYFYNSKNKLIGTYKCINTVVECNRAFSGHDKYNILNNDPFTKTPAYKMEVINEQYAFIDDSSPQQSKYGDVGYNRIIYLFDIKSNKIIARYSDVKGSIMDSSYEIATGEKSRYIVKNHKNDKWGLISISTKGNITEELGFEYDSINYDQDTGYYILSKDDKWFVYDLYKKEIKSIETADPIYDVWCNSNNTFYIKTGKERIVGSNNFIQYKVYRIDGKEFLTENEIVHIIEKAKYIMYISRTDKKLKFMDYRGDIKYEVQLYFTVMDSDDLHHPAFRIDYDKKDYLVLWVYKGRELEYDYEQVYLDTLNWR